MRLVFGTDGMRGVANESLTPQVAFEVGNALGRFCQRKKVFVGKDTRSTGDLLSLAFCSGLLSQGVNAVDIGVLPTPAVAYLTKEFRGDFGVVISASHNSHEYNGIKIFDCNGKKINEAFERNLENGMNAISFCNATDAGTFVQRLDFVKIYELMLLHVVKGTLQGMRVALDGACGAAWHLAPAVFAQMGAEIVPQNCVCDGKKINDGNGSTFVNDFCTVVLENNCDLGFCFDGDADRVLAIDGQGKVLDGDDLLFLLACDFKEEGKLLGDKVVGTIHTNLGIEKSLNREGITLLRSEIGDKHVASMMDASCAILGGEQSGHIVAKDFSSTGDGIVTALLIAEVFAKNKLHNKAFAKKCLQLNENVSVQNKIAVVNNKKLLARIDAVAQLLGEKGRVVVRPSGTEEKVRIMLECEEETLAKQIVAQLKSLVQQCDECIG